MPVPESLRLLAELDEGDGVALTRLGKRLGQRSSELIREYTQMSDATLGGQAGPGWVSLACDDGGRWTARLNAAGREYLTMSEQADKDAPESEAPPTFAPVTVQRRDAEGEREAQDEIAVEMPVALVFNGISHAVMMATPADLEAFALGFALSEGLIASKSECYGIDAVYGRFGCEVQLEVAASAEMRLKEQRRTLVGRTGCGLCGIDSLQQLDLLPQPLTPPAWARDLSAATVLRAFAQLPAMQRMNAQTGAHHAAGWANADGELEVVMEDVGRHNALDKLLGARALAKLPFDEGFVIMSSRASYELVRKSARLGVPVLAAISAPTSLAVDIARQAGLRLYGFCRGERAVRYTD
ncbi:MAG: formate dehydrogenase accessory sulfurtransferase FdhD [Burkholderiaceae bacterium]